MSLTLTNHKKSLLLTGDTKPIKEKLKELKGNWNPGLGGWLFFPGTFDGIIEYVKENGGVMNIEKGGEKRSEKKEKENGKKEEKEVSKLLMKLLKIALTSLQEHVNDRDWYELSTKITSKLKKKLKSEKISKNEFEIIKNQLNDFELYYEEEVEEEDDE